MILKCKIVGQMGQSGAGKSPFLPKKKEIDFHFFFFSQLSGFYCPTLPHLPHWSQTHIEITNQIEDVVSLNDLKDKYKNHYGLRGVSDRDFIAISKAR
jgi:hypothetical protein